MHDGRICFLDFGLMDRVSPKVMEGFADGIRSVVSRNWTALAHSMQVVEFVPDPVKRRWEICWDGGLDGGWTYGFFMFGFLPYPYKDLFKLMFSFKILYGSV